eukprot:scaffold96954_cov58-Phaeocystis_antarctica.AAC.3
MSVVQRVSNDASDDRRQDRKLQGDKTRKSCGGLSMGSAADASTRYTPAVRRTEFVLILTARR